LPPQISGFGKQLLYLGDAAGQVVLALLLLLEVWSADLVEVAIRIMDVFILMVWLMASLKRIKIVFFLLDEVIDLILANLGLYLGQLVRRLGLGDQINDAVLGISCEKIVASR